jgi:hypothetical protein
MEDEMKTRYLIYRMHNILCIVLDFALDFFKKMHTIENILVLCINL